MITFSTEIIKTLIQSIYYKFIESINISVVTCPKCGHTGYLIFHGYYNRSVVTPDGTETISIQRVKCKYCNRTHALLPDCIVPYHPVLLNDQVSLINEIEDKGTCSDFQEAFPHVSDSLIDRIYSGYKKHWRERMIAENMSFDMCLHDLVYSSFKHYRMQFLQIRKGLNMLPMGNNIT